MIRAVLSIGSNTGASRSHLRSVLTEFAGEITAVSSLYATAPWGVTDQDDFLNAVLVLSTESSPMELLRRGQRLERAAERIRERRWGPRTLDVDLIQLEDDRGVIRSDTPELVLPHPWAHERGFVLVPWLEVEPEARLDGVALRTRIDALPPAELAGIVRLGSWVDELDGAQEEKESR